MGLLGVSDSGQNTVFHLPRLRCRQLFLRWRFRCANSTRALSVAAAPQRDSPAVLTAQPLCNHDPQLHIVIVTVILPWSRSSSMPTRSPCRRRRTPSALRQRALLRTRKTRKTTEWEAAELYYCICRQWCLVANGDCSLLFPRGQRPLLRAEKNSGNSCRKLIFTGGHAYPKTWHTRPGVQP